MDSNMVVYESTESRSKNPADTTRFDHSLSLLENVGIVVERIMCSDPSDLPADGEAHDIVAENGMEVLPVMTYQGAVVTTASYPTDQDLADFLDVPDGVLSVDRVKGPAMNNDIMPACNCGQKDSCPK